MRHRAPAVPRAGSGRTARAIGVLGELLITLGVLVALFVVWQLWWTDVVAARHQSEVLDGLGWAYQEPLNPPSAPSASAGTSPERHDAAPVDAEPADVGTTFATLRVPRWGADYVRTISEGTTRSDVLDVLGIGHYVRTAMPGGIGNFAVAGHRTTYNKPFNRVEELRVGDALVVQTADTWYVYTVTSTEIVRPDQVEVIAPVPGDPAAAPSQAQMTLTTCHPMYSARQRYVVHALLDHWLPVADGPPAEITGSA
ncbi:MAG TPA: class E sortase [Actinotalea sp.]